MVTVNRESLIARIEELEAMRWTIRQCTAW